MSFYNQAIAKDKHYFVSFSLADEQKINRWVERLSSIYNNIRLIGQLIKETDNEEVIDYLSIKMAEEQETYHQLSQPMMDMVEKRHNDHRNYDAILGHDWLKVSPLNSPCLEEDMLTYHGLNKLLNVYAGNSTGIFKWVARGSTAGTIHPHTTALAAQTGSRQDATTTGFHKISGASIQLYSAFASTLATETINQIGLYDASTSGNLLAAHDFFGSSHTHTINIDSFGIGMTIDFTPFGDY